MREIEEQRSANVVVFPMCGRSAKATDELARKAAISRNLAGAISGLITRRALKCTERLLKESVP